MRSNSKPALYFDTSALLPYYRQELLSQTVQDLLISTTAEIFISHLTEVEFASVLASLKRMNEISEADALALQKKFVNHIAFGYYTLEFVSIHDFKQATNWLLSRQTTLHTLDALHLACATRANAILVTADKQQLSWGWFVNS
jgi:predicted nucleic acid-binding protein